MVLKVEMRGVQFRKTDRKLPAGEQAEFIQTRLIGQERGRVFRQDDLVKETTSLLAVRRIPTIKVVPLEMEGVAVSDVKIPKMVEIPAGSFTMGSTDYEDARPVSEVTLAHFAIGKYAVTNRQYQDYLEATGQVVPDLAADPQKPNHPVVNVRWHEAVKYTEWLTSLKLKDAHGRERRFRLPTEAEWEKAARGTDGRKFPWGNEFDRSKVTFFIAGTEPVDAHPEGASPYGVEGMSGNVWEWVADWYAGRYNPEDTQDPKGPEKGNSKVLRGGSWYDLNQDLLRSTNRFNDHPKNQGSFIGFRVAEDLD